MLEIMKRVASIVGGMQEVGFWNLSSSRHGLMIEKIFLVEAYM